MEKQVELLPKTERALVGMERKFKLNDAIYTFLLEKRAEAQIAKAGNSPEHEIVEPARVLEKVFPNTKIHFLMAIFLGLLLLLIEFAVIPGVTIAGIGGFILLGLSVYIAFSSYGTGIGFLTLSFVLIASPLMIFYFFRSKTGKKMVLESLIDGKVETVNQEKIHVGDAGRTLGRLAPSGKVKVNGEVVEAQSTGAFVDQNTEIKVVKILTNKIIVEPVKNMKND